VNTAEELQERQLKAPVGSDPQRIRALVQQLDVPHVGLGDLYGHIHDLRQQRVQIRLARQARADRMQPGHARQVRRKMISQGRCLKLRPPAFLQIVAQARLEDAATQLGGLHGQQEMTFRALIEKHQVVQGQALERSRLEKLRNDLMAKRRTRDETQARLTRLTREREQLLRQLSELRNKRFSIRNQIAERISAALSPTIRVTIVESGNPEAYLRLLEEVLKGRGIKHNQVAQKLVNAFWPADLSAVAQSGDAKALMDQAELNQDQAQRVVETLADPGVRYRLEAVELLDLPRIELKDGEDYKDSASLSTGQKCTTILPILLLDSHNPLLVDQPEDNLDNRFIFECVVNSIRNVKARRQLIFVTHNPNIPVLGDAERVFVLESDGTSGRKANEGTVDECKDEIVTLLEGGQEAFTQRQQRYAR